MKTTQISKEKRIEKYKKRLVEINEKIENYRNKYKKERLKIQNYLRVTKFRDKK